MVFMSPREANSENQEPATTDHASRPPSGYVSSKEADEAAV